MSPSKKSASRKQSHARKKRWYDSWTFFLLLVLVLPFSVRSVAYAPFHIPSGSMIPNLLVGDYIFVSKYAYGFSRYSFPFGVKFFEGRIYPGDAEKYQPQRGDIIVFRLPTNPRTDYIKRLVGLPGDRIQVREGVLSINGQVVPRVKQEDFEQEQPDGTPIAITRYRETLPNGVSYDVLDSMPEGPLDNTPVYTVPADHYFFMGDNRDSSQDSRVLEVVGYVPLENLVGRAEIVAVSFRQSLLKIWSWPASFRSNRAFTDLHH